MTHKEGRPCSSLSRWPFPSQGKTSKEEPVLPGTLTNMFSFLHCEKINVPYVRHEICGILLGCMSLLSLTDLGRDRWRGGGGLIGYTCVWTPISRVNFEAFRHWYEWPITGSPRLRSGLWIVEVVSLPWGWGAWEAIYQRYWSRQRKQHGTYR